MVLLTSFQEGLADDSDECSDESEVDATDIGNHTNDPNARSVWKLCLWGNFVRGKMAISRLTTKPQEVILLRMTTRIKLNLAWLSFIVVV